MNAFPLTLIVLLLAFVSQGAQAHTDHDKARFVAEDGVDAGKCDNRFRPCKTLSYAVRQANEGDKIFVAEGQYYFDNAQHAQVLNDSLLPVLGGFSREDHYQAQKPALHKTTLVNVPIYLSEALYEKGFDSITDGKAASSFKHRHHRTWSLVPKSVQMKLPQMERLPASHAVICLCSR